MATSTPPPPPPTSLSPPEVLMQLHAFNREKLLNSLRELLANSGRPLQGFVLLQGGEEQNRYCTNHTELFRLAEKVILDSLKKKKILTGDTKDMMDKRLGAVFMPHGLGHLLGIDTHDPGGYPKGLDRPKEPGLSALCTARELKEDMVITVEPGCYFISALFVPAMESSDTSRFFNVDAIRKFIGFGGVRIESDVLVTSTGCKNMTNVPRETWEIEAVMAGAQWPLEKGRDNSQNGIGNSH